MIPTRRRHGDGFTLVEITIGASILGLLGGMIYLLLNSGLVLSCKNSAVNSAHQQMRQAMDRMIKDIHGSMSVPTLLDGNRVALLNGVGPAPGIGFLLQSGPVLRVAADAAIGQNIIQVTGFGSTPPQVGQRLLIPSHGIEADITSAAGGTLTLAAPLKVPVTVTHAPSNFNIVAYVTDVVEYLVANNELRFYPSAGSDAYAVVARNQMNPAPFGLPFGATATPTPTPP